MEFRCTVELREPSALSHGFHGICLNISIKLKALRYPHLLNNGIGGGGDPEISFVVWGPPHPPYGRGDIALTALDVRSATSEGIANRCQGAHRPRFGGDLVGIQPT